MTEAKAIKIVVPKETHPGETRVALIPESVGRLVQKGAEVEIESGLGATIHASDADYEKAGAKVNADRKALVSGGDIVVRLRKPPEEELSWMSKGTIHISHLDPFNEKPLIAKMAGQGLSTVCMEMIPRSTRAQKMDALSSQANLAGYVAVLLAANELNKIFPMMMTPGGTIAPSRVFIVGAGVAGLQAIATAKRLGARVEAFDTRPVVEEQVQSLGAKFVKIDIGDTGQTDQGYAKALTDEQLARQREGMKKICSQSDVVITTAQVFGRRAPRIITAEMVDAMKPGSVLVDLAVETGGNVEGSEVGKVVDKNGVKIIGLANLPGHVPVHASQMYSSNVTNFLEEFWDKEKKTFELQLDDEIIKGCLIAHDGSILNENLKA